ncbi:hypothetical protein PoB_003166200, partial [Plakobranchus ocellatus]
MNKLALLLNSAQVQVDSMWKQLITAGLTDHKEKPVAIPNSLQYLITDALKASTESKSKRNPTDNPNNSIEANSTSNKAIVNAHNSEKPISKENHVGSPPNNSVFQVGADCEKPALDLQNKETERLELDPNEGSKQSSGVKVNSSACTQAVNEEAFGTCDYVYDNQEPYLRTKEQKLEGQAQKLAGLSDSEEDSTRNNEKQNVFDQGMNVQRLIDLPGPKEGSAGSNEAKQPQGLDQEKHIKKNKYLPNNEEGLTESNETKAQQHLDQQRNAKKTKDVPKLSEDLTGSNEAQPLQILDQKENTQSSKDYSAPEEKVIRDDKILTPKVSNEEKTQPKDTIRKEISFIPPSACDDSTNNSLIESSLSCETVASSKTSESNKNEEADIGFKMVNHRTSIRSFSSEDTREHREYSRDCSEETVPAGKIMWSRRLSENFENLKKQKEQSSDSCETVQRERTRQSAGLSECCGQSEDLRQKENSSDNSNKTGPEGRRRQSKRLMESGSEISKKRTEYSRDTSEESKPNVGIRRSSRLSESSVKKLQTAENKANLIDEDNAKTASPKQGNLLSRQTQMEIATLQLARMLAEAKMYQKKKDDLSVRTSIQKASLNACLNEKAQKPKQARDRNMPNMQAVNSESSKDSAVQMTHEKAVKRDRRVRQAKISKVKKKEKVVHGKREEDDNANSDLDTSSLSSCSETENGQSQKTTNSLSAEISQISKHLSPVFSQSGTMSKNCDVKQESKLLQKKPVDYSHMESERDNIGTHTEMNAEPSISILSDTQKRSDHYEGIEPARNNLSIIDRPKRRLMTRSKHKQSKVRSTMVNKQFAAQAINPLRIKSKEFISSSCDSDSDWNDDEEIEKKEKKGSADGVNREGIGRIEIGKMAESNGKLKKIEAQCGTVERQCSENNRLRPKDSCGISAFSAVNKNKHEVAGTSNQILFTGSKQAKTKVVDHEMKDAAATRLPIVVITNNICDEGLSAFHSQSSTVNENIDLGTVNSCSAVYVGLDEAGTKKDSGIVVASINIVENEVSQHCESISKTIDSEAEPKILDAAHIQISRKCSSNSKLEPNDNSQNSNVASVCDNICKESKDLPVKSVRNDGCSTVLNSTFNDEALYTNHQQLIQHSNKSRKRKLMSVTASQELGPHKIHFKPISKNPSQINLEDIFILFQIPQCLSPLPPSPSPKGICEDCDESNSPANLVVRLSTQELDASGTSTVTISTASMPDASGIKDGEDSCLGDVLDIASDKGVKRLKRNHEYENATLRNSDEKSFMTSSKNCKSSVERRRNVSLPHQPLEAKKIPVLQKKSVDLSQISSQANSPKQETKLSGLRRKRQAPILGKFLTPYAAILHDMNLLAGGAQNDIASVAATILTRVSGREVTLVWSMLPQLLVECLTSQQQEDLLHYVYAACGKLEKVNDSVFATHAEQQLSKLVSCLAAMNKSLDSSSVLGAIWREVFKQDANRSLLEILSLCRLFTLLCMEN